MPKRRIIHSYYIEQYKNYPALVILFIRLDEQKNIKGRKYISSTISEYNDAIKKILKNNSMEFARYLGLLLRNDYKKRVENDCKCLNAIDKSHLINYIVARYRDKFLRNK